MWSYRKGCQGRKGRGEVRVYMRMTLINWGHLQWNNSKTWKTNSWKTKQKQATAKLLKIFIKRRKYEPITTK
jgi:hypothetical protein